MLRRINKKVLTVFGMSFILMGLGFLMISIQSAKEFNYKSIKYEPVESTVVDLKIDYESLYSSVCRYKVNGVDYEYQTAYGQFYKDIGEKVMLKYNPDNPGEAVEVNGLKYTIYPLLSLILLLTGISIIYERLASIKVKGRRIVPKLRLIVES